jgi:hypothetical protein
MAVDLAIDALIVMVKVKMEVRAIKGEVWK